MIEVNDANWPLLEIRYEGLIDDEELDRYLTEHEALLAREEEHVALVDITQSKIYSSTPRHVRRAAMWVAEQDAPIGSYCAGVAFLVRSATQRALVRLILKLRPFAIPHVVYDDEALATAWLRERMKSLRRRPSQVTPEGVGLAEVPR